MANVLKIFILAFFIFLPLKFFAQVVENYIEHHIYKDYFAKFENERFRLEEYYSRNIEPLILELEAFDKTVQSIISKELIDKDFFQIFGTNYTLETVKEFYGVKRYYQKLNINFVYLNTSNKNIKSTTKFEYLFEASTKKCFSGKCDIAYLYEQLYPSMPELPIMTLFIEKETKKIVEINFPLSVARLPYHDKTLFTFWKRLSDKNGFNKIWIKLNRFNFFPENTEREYTTELKNSFHVPSRTFITLANNNNEGLKAIKSYNAANCLVLTIYDKKNRVGSLAHIYPTPNVKNEINLFLDRMLTSIESLSSDSTNRSNLEMWVVGGSAASEEGFFYLNREIKKITTNISYDIFSKDEYYKHVYFDLETGKVFDVENDENYFKQDDGLFKFTTTRNEIIYSYLLKPVQGF